MTDRLLPAGYAARPATLDDAATVAALRLACELADGGPGDTTPEEQLEGWAGIDLANETVLVLAPDGGTAAYADLVNRRFAQILVYGFVHPEQRGHGLGAFLVRWGEAWVEERIAKAPPNAGVAVQHFMRSTDTAGRRLLESHDYAPIRTHYVMAVDLAQPPAPAEWPVGIGVRTFVPGEDDEVLFQAGEEAMSDQANRPPSTRERWLAPTTTPGFDPSLWWLAVEEASGEIAGVCLCSFVSGAGHVNGVGVRRAWRRRGLALALLLNALGELRRRGAAEARLSVDSDSPTGAPRVYTRAGMHVARSYVRYSKDLRPAAEPTAAAERS